MHRIKILVCALWAALAVGPLIGCAAATSPEAASADAPDAGIYATVLRELERNGRDIDYDTLVHVYRSLSQSPRPIEHLDRLLDQLIRQRHTNPRIDQMVLILSAKLIGQSTVFIPNAQSCFRTILDQQDRLSEWVIAFVSEAIATYPFDLPEGDALMDHLEARLEQVRAKDRSGEEFFGYHFLPPPQSHAIKAYINGIRDRSVREHERARYYILIQNNISERAIEAGLTYLRNHGEPESGATCSQLMACLLRRRDHLLLKQGQP